MHSVLVIDDEKFISDSLGKALKKHGYKVETASSGREGMQKFDGGPYDLVITDLLMPDLDGMAVLQHIRGSKKPSTPVIGISGTPWLLKEDCFDAVLAKPFSIHTMLAVLEKLRPRLEETLDEIISGVQQVTDPEGG